VKRIALLLAALFAAGTLAIAAAVSFVPADAIRAAVESRIKAATGLHPDLRGPVSISMFPAPTVEFSDVALSSGDPARRGAPDARDAMPGTADAALQAGRLVVNLRLIPLLAQRVEIADILLVRPRIAVTIERDGRTNWATLIDILARALKPDAGHDEQVLSFSEIAIQDGAVTLHVPGQDVDETLEDVELSLAWPALARSFAATGHFTWRHQVVDASLAIANFPGALAGDDSGVKLRAAAGSVKAAFDGTMSYRPSLKIDGTLAADAASLREALTWSGGHALPAGGLGTFAIKARTTVTGRTISLSDLNVELDGNVAEGVLSYATTGRQSFQGTLAVESLDLNPYVSTFQLLADNARDWDRRALMLEWFDGWEADVRLSAARVQLPHAELGRTAVAASMRASRMTVTVGESQAFDGVVTGAITVARSEAGADFSSEMQFSEVNLQRCLGQLFDVDQLSGSGSVGFSIASSGRSVKELAGNLNGTVHIAAVDGGLSGLNVEQAMRRLQRSPLSSSGDLRAGRTPFDRLDIGLSIAQGLATIDNVALEGPGVRLAVTGSTSIPEREFNLAGTANLISDTSDAATLFELPFTVKGQWTSPSIAPDTRALKAGIRTGPRATTCRTLSTACCSQPDRCIRSDAAGAMGLSPRAPSHAGVRNFKEQVETRSLAYGPVAALDDRPRPGNMRSLRSRALDITCSKACGYYYTTTGTSAPGSAALNLSYVRCCVSSRSGTPPPRRPPRRR
jgi:AsmA protein